MFSGKTKNPKYTVASSGNKTWIRPMCKYPRIRNLIILNTHNRQRTQQMRYIAPHSYFSIYIYILFLERSFRQSDKGIKAVSEDSKKHIDPLYMLGEQNQCEQGYENIIESAPE